MNKPERRIFKHLVQKFDVEPAAALFADGSPANGDAARALGFHAVQFTDDAALRQELVQLGLLLHEILVSATPSVHLLEARTRLIK